MKLGKALSTGYAQDAFEQDAFEHGTDRERSTAEEPAERRTPDPVKAAAEAARPRQVVDAAAR